jgi:hypothetical protein
MPGPASKVRWWLLIRSHASARNPCLVVRRAHQRRSRRDHLTRNWSVQAAREDPWKPRPSHTRSTRSLVCKATSARLASATSPATYTARSASCLSRWRPPRSGPRWPPRSDAGTASLVEALVAHQQQPADAIQRIALAAPWPSVCRPRRRWLNARRGSGPAAPRWRGRVARAGRWRKPGTGPRRPPRCWPASRVSLH